MNTLLPIILKKSVTGCMETEKADPCKRKKAIRSTAEPLGSAVPI